MRVEYSNEFECSGNRFTGDLAIVDYREQWNEIDSTKPLGGFGSPSFYDALDEARQLLQMEGVEGEEVLSIPVLVVWRY